MIEKKSRKLPGRIEPREDVINRRITGSLFEKKSRKLPGRSEIPQANTHLNNRGPKQHLCGDQEDSAFHPKGIPHPFKNSVYA